MLTTPLNGKTRRLTFKDTLIGNIREFLNTFRDRNITDDLEMQSICERAEQLLSGVDPQDLRDSDAKRDQIANQFIEIRAALDTMLVPRGSRVIQFEDEPTGDIAITTGPEVQQAVGEANERVAAAEAMGLFEATPEAVTA